MSIIGKPNLGRFDQPNPMRPVRPAHFTVVSPAVAAAVQLTPLVVDAVPQVRPSLSINVADVRFVRPDLGNLIGKVRLPEPGVPREKITVPICPVEDVTDQVLFEAAANPAEKFYLPRYRLEVQNQQYRVSLAQSGQDWSLTLYLEKYPAPEIAEAARGAKDLEHAVIVILNHRLLMGGSSAGQKEWVFQEVIPGAVIQATLRVSSLPERDQLYQALTDPAFGATLTIRRAILGVAIPVTQSTDPTTLPQLEPIVLPIHVPIEPPAPVDPTPVDPGHIHSPVVNIDPNLAVVRPHLGDINADVIAVRPGHLQQITMVNPALLGQIQLTRGGTQVSALSQHFFRPPPIVGTPPPEPRFHEVTRALDHTIAPQPFVFPPNLHGYIFGNIAPTPGQSFQLIRRQVGAHTYCQDQAPAHRFYYFPDGFKITRRPQSPHYPLMEVRFTEPAPEALPEDLQVTVDYVAIPFVDPERLAADAAQLRQWAGPLPPGVDGPVLDPLLVEPEAIKFRLSLPGANPASGPYQERSGALVDLRSGIHDRITLSMPDFRTMYAALFSGSAVLFDGRVEVELDEVTEVIPFAARISDLAGELFDYKEFADPESGGLKIQLLNAIESPMRVNQLVSQLRRGRNQVPGQIQKFVSLTAEQLPVELKPGEEIRLLVVPATPLEGPEPLQVAFDLDEVEVLPDKDAVWKAILDPHTSAYVRVIHIKTTAQMFAPPPDRPEAQIIEIDIELKRGDQRSVTVPLTPQDLEFEVQLPAPVGDFVLDKFDPNEYSYRVTTIRGTEAKEGQWKTKSADILWILSNEVN